MNTLTYQEVREPVFSKKQVSYAVQQPNGNLNETTMLTGFLLLNLSYHI